tara:strand:+ start:480 stop:914 length:435 start_codon:yes stop_codon:yes gene_type:complete
MRTITINIYKIDEHPNKEKCYEWIRENVQYIGDYEVDELISSITKLSDSIGGFVAYNISQYAEQGECITFMDYDEDLLEELNADECPLTGCFWDVEVINALKAKDMTKVFETLHNSIEHLYSDEALEEMCEANDYEFYESGERV